MDKDDKRGLIQLLMTGFQDEESLDEDQIKAVFVDFLTGGM